MDRVVVGFAHPEEVAWGFTDSIMRLLLADAARPLGRRRLTTEGAGYVHVASGPRIASARNMMVALFLEQHTAEWLWMLDADMTFKPEVLDILLSVADPEKRPIVGGLCFGGGKGKIFPTLYQIVDPKENDGKAIKYIIDWPENAVVQVDATGGACLLIHRSVLEKMQANAEQIAEEHDANVTPCIWFHESVYKEQEFGEDWTFCLKAGSLGIPIYVATAAKVGHVKTFELNEELWRSGKVALEFVGGAPHEREAGAVTPLLPTFQPSKSSGMSRAQRREVERRARKAS